MFSVKIHIELNSDFVLSEMEQFKEEPFSVYYFETFNENMIKFVVDAGRYREEAAKLLDRDESVRSVELVSETLLLITKKSSGIIPVIRRNHGLFQNVNQFKVHTRMFEIVVFERDDLKDIIADLRQLGDINVRQLTPIEGPAALLSSRQQEVISLAHAQGYFDWPRDTELEPLAEQLDISHTTFLEHLRKAEAKILDETLKSDSPA
ncbi:helix-turn-helix domain-containing protein [Halococcus sp. IIIV-5B]|uniref:helix-turn-helix domain-containing protein n=1 Tax=Halococcus sp. IIIV-5B TaxID=2321230 RepID=UPI000E75CA15|nr:helix-turn-helix domain-containing protein [Halococcus sp. IIIV-5B]RJT07979.1 helix-turn-helix domain-containing protein [Halococcus sp. IIIV-5B]